MIHLGDCEDVLRWYPPNSIDLIVTSPPYADARKLGVDPDKYVRWIGPKLYQMKRVLRPEGTLILNIKERVVGGERHTYVLELIQAMREHSWLWTEEFIWHKKNCYPGKWPNRFRDAWERCLQFNLEKKFYMNQDAVKVPVGKWAASRLKNLSETDKTRDESSVGSGFGKKVENWIDRDMVYPTNVLHLATETGNTGHSAAFPVELPRWFIKLFTRPNGMVLDPFCGSGTVGVAARQLDRRFVGIEIDPKFYELATKRLKP